MEMQKLRQPYRKTCSICFAIVVSFFSIAITVNAEESDVEKFGRFLDKANVDFEKKRFAEAEDSYAGAIAIGNKIADPEKMSALCQSYAGMAKSQFATGRVALAQQTCEKALMKISHDHANDLGPIAEELFKSYMRQRRWQDAVRIFFALFSDTCYEKKASYIMSFVPPQSGISDNELPMEKAQEWFHHQSTILNAPDLYTEYCRGCIAADADDYVRDQEAKGTCVAHLMSKGRYSDVIPYLRTNLKNKFWLGSSSVGYPKDTAENLAICLRKTGQNAEANKIDAVLKARKDVPGSNCNYNFGRLVSDAWEAFGAKEELVFDVKLETLKSAYNEMAFTGDMQAHVDVRALEGAEAELHKDYLSARKIYTECLAMSVINYKKAVAAQGMSRICTVLKNPSEARKFDKMAVQLRDGY